MHEEKEKGKDGIMQMKNALSEIYGRCIHATARVVMGKYCDHGSKGVRMEEGGMYVQHKSTHRMGEKMASDQFEEERVMGGWYRREVRAHIIRVWT